MTPEIPPPTPEIPGPEVTPETDLFWEATARGELLVKVCTACEAAYWYPRARCPFCLSDSTEWQRASGHGTIYSYTIMRREPVPYALASVTLDEGMWMLTNVVDCDLDTITIGQRVRVVFHPTNGAPVPMFTPR